MVHFATTTEAKRLGSSDHRAVIEIALRKHSILWALSCPSSLRRLALQECDSRHHKRAWSGKPSPEPQNLCCNGWDLLRRYQLAKTARMRNPQCRIHNAGVSGAQGSPAAAAPCCRSTLPPTAATPAARGCMPLRKMLNPATRYICYAAVKREHTLCGFPA